MTAGQALVWVLIALPYYFTLVIVVTTLEDTMEFIKAALKAIVGTVVAGVSSFAAAKGIDLTPAQTSFLTALLTGLGVYVTRNKVAQ